MEERQIDFLRRAFPQAEYFLSRLASSPKGEVPRDMLWGEVAKQNPAMTDPYAYDAFLKQLDKYRLIRTTKISNFPSIARHVITPEGREALDMLQNPTETSKPSIQLVASGGINNIITGNQNNVRINSELAQAIDQVNLLIAQYGDELEEHSPAALGLLVLASQQKEKGRFKKKIHEVLEILSPFVTKTAKIAALVTALKALIEL